MLMKTSCTKLLLTLGVGLLLTPGVNAQSYCGSGATSNVDSKITNVQLGNINNATGGSGCVYNSDFTTTSMTTDLYVGSSYQLSVTLGNHSGCGSDVYTKSARAYIDFNGDYDFSDAGENLGITAYTSNTFTSVINFQVPCIAVGGTKRLRIVCAESNPNPPSCGTFTWGETEDYNVNIIPGSSPTADFALPDTVYSNWVATFANINQGGYTHKWYNSDIDPTMQTLASTSVNYQYSFSTAGTYSLRLESTNCQGTAIKTKQVVVIDPTSTPVANFVSSINVFYFSGNPVEIDLFDLSAFGPSSWEWTITPDVGNGAPWFWSNGNQFSQNPSAFFYDIGTYEVCLTVTNSLGSSAPLCRSAYIIITPPTGSNFTNIMGEDFKSTLDSGEIFDSGGPTGNYGDNEYYEFIIEPCGASSITLNINALDLEANWDFLRIYDGPDASSAMLAEFTGTTVPSGSIKSSQGSMTLLMTSDGNTVGAGFAASWTSNIPQNGTITADIDLPDTLWECSGGTDLVLLNATTGVVPGQATYDWIIDYDPNVTYPAMYCDYCDEENPEWNVPASGQYEEYFIRMVAKSCEGNDTVVKVLRVSPTTNLPDVEFEASNRRVSAGSVVTLTDMSVAGCSYEWEITPAGWALEPGYALTDRIIEVKFNNAGSYHVEMEVTNDNGTATETKTNYIDVIDYCTPSIVIPSIADVGITRVKIENINNETSSGKSPGYFNYTADFAVVLTAGQTYQLTLERPSTVNSMTRKAWIDFNRDGEFQEATERVMLETNANSLSYTATFTVPDYTYTLEGESRLRVGASLGANSFNSCGPIQVGEFEDYGVMLRFDDMPPVITLIGSNSILLEVNTTYNEEGATALDNIEGDISSRIVITNQVDMSQPGIYFVHYDVTDGSGLMATRVTRTVTVSTDITEPVITLIGGSPVVHSVLVPFTDPGYTALDNPGNKNVTGDVVVTGNVDVNVIGDYDLTYKVSDINGNSSSVVRTVQVRDIDAPVISSPANVFWQVGTPFVKPVSITDNFDQNVQVSMTGSINVNVFGTYTVTFNAVDFSGNSATPVTVVFEVGDAIAPVISTLQGTNEIIVEVNNANFFEPPVTATDNYYPNVSVVRNASALNIYVLGSYPVIYTATDGSGNTATYTRTIHVVDIEKPVVIAPPMNIQRWSNTFAPLNGLSILDNYWSPQWFVDNPTSVEVVLSNVDVNYPGIYNVVYRVTDGSGNVSSLTTRIVYVWTPTSLEGVDLGSMIQVYPNPSNGAFTVKLDEQLESHVSIQIVDALGKGVFNAGSEAFVNGEAKIDLSHVTAGVYLIQLNTEQGTVSKRIVIQ